MFIFQQCVRYPFKNPPFTCYPFSSPQLEGHVACFGQRHDLQHCCQGGARNFSPLPCWGGGEWLDKISNAKQGQFLVI